MPKRVLIIDDRPKRPFLHLPETTVRTIQQLQNVDLKASAKGVDFGAYDIIAIHKSYATSNNFGNMLDNLILDNAKYIVYFSGGISQQVINQNGHQAILGSEVFYSKNLLPFCEQLLSSEDIQLFKLIYGVDHWKLPILMRLRQIYWMDPKGEDFRLDDERQDIIDALGLDNVQITMIEKIINKQACLL